jgi:hypothetical protein
MLLTWPFVLYDDRLVTAELFSGEVTRCRLTIIRRGSGSRETSRSEHFE